MQGPSLLKNPFPTTTQSLWNASLAHAPNSIKVSLVAAQYFVTVYGTAASNFTIVAMLNEALYPVPGGGGSIVVSAVQSNTLLLAGDPMSMSVTFETAQTNYGNEDLYQYRVLNLPVIEGEPCGDANFTSSDDCILSSVCGAETLMLPFGATPWTVEPAGTNVTIQVDGLTQNQQYTFVVEVQSPSSGFKAVYTGSRGTPTYTRVSQATSNTTIIIIACCSGGGFLALVGCIVWAKTRLNRRMKEYRAFKAKNAAMSKPLVGGDKGKTDPVLTTPIPTAPADAKPEPEAKS